MINEVNCTQAFENTGHGRCTFNPREIVGMLLVSATFAITPAMASNLQTSLETSVKNPIRLERTLPVMGFEAFTDGSDEPVREVLGYGVSRTLRDGNYNWTFRYIEGGMCLHKSLLALKGQRVFAIFIDAAGNLIGTMKNGNLAGVPIADFWPNKWTPSDGSGVSTTFSLFVSFKPEYINEKLAFISTKGTTFDPTTLRGIQDVNINVISATAASAVVELVDKCSGDADAFNDLYADELGVVGAFVATDAVTGAAQVISAVSYSAATKRMTLTFTPARTNATNLRLGSLSVLDGLGVPGYESLTVLVPLTKV